MPVNDLETGKSYRIISTEDSRELAALYAPEIAEKRKQQVEAYKRMPDSVLFRVQGVEIVLSEFDLPGPTHRKTVCSRCGQAVRDGREVVIGHLSLCKPCTEGAYFRNAREVSWQGMNWSPEERRTLPSVTMSLNSQPATLSQTQ